MDLRDKNMVEPFFWQYNPEYVILATAKVAVFIAPKHDVNSLFQEIIDADLARMRRDSYLKQVGFRVFNYHE